MGSEEGKYRTLESGSKLREPCWVGEKCEWCGKEVDRMGVLLEIRLV